MAVEGITQSYYADVEEGEWYNPVEELNGRGYSPWIITPETDTVEKSLIETAKRLGKVPTEEDIAISRKPLIAGPKYLALWAKLISAGVVST